MRFHCLGVPHTVTSPDYPSCAFTQKVLKFCKMMRALGHHVIHYGHEDSDLECNEHVTVVTNQDMITCYGHSDWIQQNFKIDTDNSIYQVFQKRTIEEIEKRKQPFDFILPFWGIPGRPICDAHPDLICVEPGIGYASGHWAQWKVFESSAILHAYMGLESAKECKPKWYDMVIPNYFDPEDFQFQSNKQDYFLFLGRVYNGKGLDIAVQVTEHIGAKLIVAGPGTLQEAGYVTKPKHVTELGLVDKETRRTLLSNAKAVITGSLFLEPFCGVHMEAMMSGTPVISSDWGVFTETNLHGITGYRCRVFNDWVWAARNIHKISPYWCRDWASNFTLDKIGPRYERFFKNVHLVKKHQGWYDTTDTRPPPGGPAYPNTAADPRYQGVGLDLRTNPNAPRGGMGLDWVIITDRDQREDWIGAKHIIVVQTTGRNRHLLKYKDVHKGGRALVVCNGPSANEYDWTNVPPGTVVMGFNAVIKKPEIRKHLDYLFVNDWGSPRSGTSFATIPQEYMEYQPKIEKFFSHNVQKQLELGGRDEPNNYTKYWYRDNVKLVTNHHEKYGMDTVLPHPEFLGGVNDNLTEPITTFGSVTFVGIQFLLWCGIRDIDIIGVDIGTPFQFTGENRVIPYTEMDHIRYWTLFFKHYDDGQHEDVIFRKSLKQILNLPRQADGRGISGSGQTLNLQQMY